MARPEETLRHATCVAFGGDAVLLRGAPGSGKSDLALRILSAFGKDGARLVADDQVRLTREGEALCAEAPETIAGRMEVRGVGIVEAPRKKRARVRLIVDLSEPGDVPRLPPEPLACEELLGVAVPVLRLAPFEASAPAKVRLALTRSI